MNNGKKIFIAVLIDLALLATLIGVCYLLIFREVSYNMQKLLTVFIVMIIPTMFYVSYQTFAGNKFDFDEKKYEQEFGDDLEDDQDEEINEKHKDNLEVEDVMNNDK